MDVTMRLGIAGGSHGHGHRRIGIPRVRPVRHRADFGVEPGVPDVADDADDFVFEASQAMRTRLPIGSSPGQCLACHGLVDDDAALGVGRILIVEEPPLQERHTHRLEIPMGDDADVGDRLLALSAGLAGRRSPSRSRRQDRERKKADCAGGLDARQRVDLLEEPRRGTAPADRRRHSAPAAARAASSSCARRRTRGFWSSKRTKLRNSRPAPTSRTRASATSTTTNALRVRFPREPDPERPPSLSESVRLDAGCGQRRDGAEDEPAHERDAEREEQHVRVDADHLETLNWQSLGDDGAQKTECPPGEKEPAHAAEGREDEALGQQLSDEPCPRRRRARRARRALAAARSRAPAGGWRRSRRRSAARRQPPPASTISAGTDVARQLLADQVHDSRRPARVEVGEHLRQVRETLRHVELRAFDSDSGLQTADDRQRAARGESAPAP